MSLPKSKVLNVTKGMVANVSLRYGSPKQSQIITVNIQPNGETSIKNENENEDQPLPNVCPTQPGFVCYGDANPYANLLLPSSPEDFHNILFQKDQQVRALNLIIDIITSNPLMVNKFVIAHYNTLNELIRLLTYSDEVEFTERTDIEFGCCGGAKDNLFYLDKIFVRKNNTVMNLKYSFPDVIRVLEEHKISIKLATMN
jgi:hypothetical protein